MGERAVREIDKETSKYFGSEIWNWAMCIFHKIGKSIGSDNLSMPKLKILIIKTSLYKKLSLMKQG